VGQDERKREPMGKPQYRHLVVERSATKAQQSAFDVLTELDIVTPDGLSATVCSHEPPWRRVWRFENTASAYVALFAHVVASPDTEDQTADDVDLILVVSLMSEITHEHPGDAEEFDELAESTRQFADSWAALVG
jgi:hypothetical protein